MNKAGSGSQTVIDGANNGSLRWQVILGNNQTESGGNVGSGFVIQRFSDSGAAIDQPLQIARTNGTCTFSTAIVNGPSDGSLKENIEPLQGSLDKVRSLQGVSYNMIGEEGRNRVDRSGRRACPARDRSGLRQGEGLKALDYPKLTALLIEAVKELASELAAVKAQIA